MIGKRESRRRNHCGLYVSYSETDERILSYIFLWGGLGLVQKRKQSVPLVCWFSAGWLGSVGGTCTANIYQTAPRQPMIFSFGCCVCVCYVSWLVWLVQTSAAMWQAFLFFFSFRLGIRPGNYISLFPTRPSTLTTTHRYCTTLAAAAH